jgi:hypothetical protein
VDWHQAVPASAYQSSNKTSPAMADWHRVRFFCLRLFTTNWYQSNRTAVSALQQARSPKPGVEIVPSSLRKLHRTTYLQRQLSFRSQDPIILPRQKLISGCGKVS